jgi:hypothetical protein
MKRPGTALPAFRNLPIRTPLDVAGTKKLREVVERGEGTLQMTVHWLITV